MFIEKQEQITVTRESLKKYGPTGAVILQVLFAEYGNTIPMSYETWHKKGGLLDFIDQSVVSSTLNTLHKRGKILIDYDKAVLYLVVDSIFALVDVPEEPKPARKEVKNEVWEMSVAICNALGQVDGLQTPKQFLKFAKELLQAGYTPESLDKYKRGSWWYNEQFKGKNGMAPNVSDIRKTIGLQNVVSTKDSEFWR